MIGSVIFLIFGLTLTTSRATMILQDYRLAPDSSTNTCTAPPLKDCTAPGPLCESCTSLALCVERPAGHFEKTQVQKCNSDAKCVGTECTATVRDPVCDGTACLDFVCTDVGVFPDAFDCRKFVFCVLDGSTRRLKAYASTCEAGYGFDPATGVCTVKLDGDGQCPAGYPVPLCGQAGETKALEANPSIYYVCQRYSQAKPVLYPLERICPHGLVFNNDKYQCE